MARFERYFTPEEATLLGTGGALNFLISDHINGAEDDSTAFDIHFRENNKLMYYHGTTCVLIATVNRQSVKFTADKRYRRSKHAGDLFKSWRVENALEIRNSVKLYLAGIRSDVANRYYANGKEGFWQNKLCRYYGPKWDESKEWLIIDRECVLGFKTGKEKKEFYEQKRERYQNIRTRMQSADQKSWGAPKKKGFGDELDMLAISPSKELLTIELKHGGNTSGIYWAPLQVSVYHDAFGEVLESISEGIKTMVAQKVNAGLLPQTALSRLPQGNFTSIRAVVAIGKPPSARSRCWKKMTEVLATMTDLKLSPDIDIATFDMKDGGMSHVFKHS